MSEPRKGKVTSLGWARDDDPIYTNAGWKFIMGKNLAPPRNEEPQPEDEVQPPTVGFGLVGGSTSTVHPGAAFRSGWWPLMANGCFLRHPADRFACVA